MAGEHGNNLGGELCDKLFAILKARIPDIDRSVLKSKCTFHRRGEKKPVWVNVEHNSGEIHVRPFGENEQVRQVFVDQGISPARINTWLKYEVGGTGDLANIGVLAEATLELLAVTPGILPVAKIASGSRTNDAPNSRIASIKDIAEELNHLSSSYLVGSLQIMRQKLNHRAPSGRKIFDPQTIFSDYAYHYGGRSELQFNIGIEGDELRHGVAFSFEPSRAFPWNEMEKILLPKARLFNSFVGLYAESFCDMRMWYDDKNKRIGPDEMPGPIPSERARPGIFSFLGKRQRIDNFSCELILHDFDRLLPLYTYVEGGGAPQFASTLEVIRFDFHPGCSEKPFGTFATPAQRQLDVNLRHNEIQEELYRLLVREYGKENVGTEIPCGDGKRIDVVLRKRHEYCFYEIKTAGSARACIREAVGQLLEYAFWPGAQPANRLIVVGESAIDSIGQEYLLCLRDRFSLRIEYQQLAIQ